MAMWLTYSKCTMHPVHSEPFAWRRQRSAAQRSPLFKFALNWGFSFLFQCTVIKNGGFYSPHLQGSWNVSPSALRYVPHLRNTFVGRIHFVGTGTISSSHGSGKRCCCSPDRHRGSPISGFFPGVKRPGVKLTIHVSLVLRLRMRGVIPPLHAFMSCTRSTLLFLVQLL